MLFEQAIYAGQLMSVSDMLAVERQKILYPGDGSCGNMQRVSRRFCRQGKTKGENKGDILLFRRSATWTEAGFEAKC